MALHSQDIVHRVKRMEGEADFVVVAPGLCVLVLEVKGCHRHGREHGLWYFGADAAGDPRGRFKAGIRGALLAMPDGTAR